MRAQGTFIRFMDGNVQNSHVDNLVFVGLEQCMKNISTWTADWDMDLTEEEVALVRDPAWRAKLTFGKG